MVKDKLLYDEMLNRYEKYITHDYLKQCRHEFDTQMNEGMNNSVSHYAPKGMNFSGTTSLQTRVYVAAGVQLVGHHCFWTSALSLLDVNMTTQLETALILRDKKKVRKFFREHDHENMAKRNKLYHDKFRAELIKSQNDAKRGAVYSSMTTCEGSNPKQSKNECAHHEYGCGGQRGHKTAVSKWCLYNKKKGVELASSKEAWANALSKMTSEASNIEEFHFPMEVVEGK